jgi:NO-binding membrane sensor protein with MHYT domain
MLIVPILAMVFGICAIVLSLMLLNRRCQQSSGRWLTASLLGAAAAGLGLWSVHLKG